MQTNADPSCSLESRAFQERVAWIATLNRQFLRSSERNGRFLRLVYDSAALGQVEEMVARERDCCAFLDFELRQGAAVELIVTVPAHAEEHAEQLLAPFHQPEALADANACCGTCNAPAPPVRAGTPTGAALTTSAAAALACSACCVLPLAFPAIAATAAGGMLVSLGRAHLWVTVLAVVIVVAAWLWIWRQAATRKARISNATLGWMGVASLVTLIAVAWPQIEPSLMAVLT